MFWGLLMIGLPISAIIAALIYLPFYFKGRKQKISWYRHSVQYLFIGSCVLITFATLLLGIRFNLSYGKLNLRPFIWLTEVYEMGFRAMIEQLILNMFMFVPLGILLPIVFKGLRRFWKTALYAFAMTFFIEFVQYFTGRSADIDDILMNLSGGMLGYGIYYLMNQIMQQSVEWKKLMGLPVEELESLESDLAVE